ncbi:MAG TPA: hypothetical protein PKA37_05735, partial [Planctomycetota bacterium]|nr:hypothetical protein [Planctomycetota bacterium]
TDAKERLQGFWELPGAWFPLGIEPVAGLEDSLRTGGLLVEIRGRALATVRHSITHHRIRAELYLAVPTGPIPEAMRYRSVEESGALTTETRKLLGAIQKKATT